MDKDLFDDETPADEASSSSVAVEPQVSNVSPVEDSVSNVAMELVDEENVQPSEDKKSKVAALLGSSSEEEDDVPKKKSTLKVDDDDDDDDDIFGQDEGSDKEVAAVAKSRVNDLLGDSSEDENPKATVEKRRALLGESSEDEDKDDLFGDDEEEEEEESGKKAKPQKSRKTAKVDEEKEKEKTTTKKPSKARKDKPSSEMDVEEPEKVRERPVAKAKERPPLKEVELDLPASHSLDTDENAVFLRLPKFLGMEAKPFDSSYEAPRDKFQTAVVRCKKEKSGALLSNARLLKWDDGSYQLVVADSTFNVKFLSVPSVYMYEHQDATLVSGEEQTSCSVLECNGVVQSKMSVAPTSLHSESHAKMSLSLLQKFKKEDKIQLLEFDQLQNPDKTMQDLVKREEEKIKQEMKNQAKLNKDKGEREKKVPQHRASMRATYIDAEDEEDDFIDDGDEDANDQEEEEEEEGEEEEEERPVAAAPKIAKRKSTVEKDESDRDAAPAAKEEEEEEDEEQVGFGRHKSKKARVSQWDSDEDDE